MIVIALPRTENSSRICSRSSAGTRASQKTATSRSTSRAMASGSATPNCGYAAVDASARSAASVGPRRTSGSMSAPFGHTTVPNSSSTRTWRKSSGSWRNGSNIGPQSSPERSTSRIVPSEKRSQRTNPARGSAATIRIGVVELITPGARWYREARASGPSASCFQAPANVARPIPFCVRLRRIDPCRANRTQQDPCKSMMGGDGLEPPTSCL